MRVIVKKWGNSAAVRIPGGVMEAAGLYLDEPVDVREERGRIVIDPIRQGKYDLAKMLSAITRGNLHGSVDFDRPVGQELM